MQYGQVDSRELNEDLKAFGVATEVKDAELPTLLVFEENLEALDVYTAMTTQWNVTAFGQLIGMNYGSLESLLRLFDVKDKVDCFSRVRFMECETLRLDKERKNGSAAQV